MECEYAWEKKSVRFYIFCYHCFHFLRLSMHRGDCVEIRELVGDHFFHRVGPRD